MVQIAVIDRDLDAHDPVGTWETTLGELVSRSGSCQESFIDADGRLHAGGIISINLSTERR